jgi:hypothetical protein
MKTWHRILLAVIMIGFVSFILVYKLVYNKPHPDYEHEKAAFVLPAQSLYDQFKQNASEATLKFSGKIIEVDGVATAVEESDSLVIVSFVFGQGDFGDQGVRISMLPDNMEKARQIQPGDPVKIKGLCTGYNDTDVIIEKGSFVQ